MSVVTRSADAPAREALTWEELWESADEGLIACWESGRALALRDPSLAALAQSGALPPLPWKGGTTSGLKKRTAYGTLYYLAMWQGLRGAALLVDLTRETTIRCAATGVVITYTNDRSKWRS